MLVHNTAFAMNIVENVAIRCGQTVAVFSMEMPAEHLVMRMLSSLGRSENHYRQTAQRSHRLGAPDFSGPVHPFRELCPRNRSAMKPP
jgi:replicative DNA helicase